jgi:hypothetical protein
MHSLKLGWTACPSEFTDIKCSAPETLGLMQNTTMQLHVSRGPITTVYNSTNAFIVSVNPFKNTESITFMYAADDIFYVLQSIFNNSEYPGDSSTELSPAADFIDTMSKILYGSLQGPNLELLEKSFFRNFLAFPLYYVNEARAWPRSLELPTDMQVTGYRAKDQYQLIISMFSLCTFTVLTVLTLIWCAVVLLYCWFQRTNTPITSLYPEFDFAANVVDNSQNEWFRGMKNADSRDVEKQMSKIIKFSR